MSDKKLNKEILSIDFDDDNKDYLKFSEFLDDHTKRRKGVTAHEIESMGGDMLAEIDKKKERYEVQKDKYIKYILKHEDLIYSMDELKKYEFSEVRKIYLEVKEKNQSFLKKVFKFLFNL